jgi:hypothetical protein
MSNGARVGKRARLTRPEADRPPLDVGGDRSGPSRGMASRGRALPARMDGRVNEDRSDKCWVGISAPASMVHVRLCADGTARPAEHHPPSGPIDANAVHQGTLRIAAAGPPGRFDPHRGRARSRPRASGQGIDLPVAGQRTARRSRGPDLSRSLRGPAAGDPPRPPASLGVGPREVVGSKSPSRRREGLLSDIAVGRD